MTTNEIQFPQWGFWVCDGLQLTGKRHLFLTEKTTTCGWNPTKGYWGRYNKFSATPKVDGLYEVMSEVYRGRLHSVDDFSKCKKCLTIEGRKPNDK